MISVDDTTQISGTIAATSTGSFTVNLNEIYLDGQWRKFNPAKTLSVATSDYDAELTAQELALVKVLAAASKTSATLTQDQQQVAASIIAKLG